MSLRRRAQAALMACVLMVGNVQAAARGDLLHRVQAGDTLQALGERYLRTPSRWRELQAINHLADPGALGAGSVVRVPRALLRPAALATAKVEFVQGAATGVVPVEPPAPAKKTRTAPPMPPALPAPIAAGDAVTEGLRIQVPADGYLRLRLADGSVVRVLAESDVELKRLRGKRGTGAYESVIKVRSGKVESDVAPQPKGRLFEIHAPGAVASVRGTHFAVSVTPDGRVSTAVTEGVVKVQPHVPPGRRAVRSADVRAGEGAVLEAGGAFHKRPALPPAPDLSSLPAVLHDADLLVLHLPPPDATLAGYEVRIGRPDHPGEVLRNGTFASGRIQFAPLDDGDYRISVRAIDREGLSGPKALHAFRVHARPVPPLYQSPAPGARITSDAGQLICSDVAHAQGVQLQVSATEDFERPVLDETRTTGCHLGVAALPPGPYWWRVASLAADASGAPRRGPFAAPQPFTIAPTPGITDLALDESHENPTLRWHGESGQSFRAQLARDIDFRTPLLDVELTTPHWTLTGLARGSYYVRLQARDASGLVGPFSPARRVRIGPVVNTSSGELLSTTDGTPIDRP